MADLGDTLTFSADLYSDAPENGGAPVDAVTATLTVTLPDGTTTTPTVPAPAAAGKYTADYVTSPTGLPGRYVGQWLFTLAGGKTTSHVETFDVGGSLITTDEAAAHLRATGVIVKAADLEQLQWLCMVATEAVEGDLGRCMVKRTVTETHPAGNVLALHWLPVVSVTAVTVDGVALAYSLNPRSGLLYPSPTYGNVTVTYVAGYNDPPRVARMVALNVVQSLWQSSQQASHPLLDESTDLNLQDAVAGLPDPLRQAYERLRVTGIA